MLHASRPTHAAGISDDGIALDEPIETATVTAEPPVRRDDWQSRQRARHVSRVLRRTDAGAGTPSTQAPSIARRFDPPQNLFENLERLTAPNIASPSVATTTPHMRAGQRRDEGGQLAAWLLVVFGALALAGGVAAIGWSLGTDRMEFWNPALGLTLAGQGLLIFGLVLVVSRLWRNSRYATGKLQDAHTRLIQLQRTADVLTATRTGGAPAFYAELVRGASPQILVANLKGQLDQLATRVGSNS